MKQSTEEMPTIRNLNGFYLSLLLVLCPVFSSALSDKTDSAALLAFKSSLAGSAASLDGLLYGWDNSSSPCHGSWVGVSCSPSTQRVIRVVLEDLGLAGDLQPLGRLTELRVLSLKLNRFSALTVNFSLWPNLKQLHLSHNEFTGNFPPGISHLRRLRRVDLSHNDFSGKIPLADLAQLPHLLTLRLEANSFVGTLAPAPPSASISDFNVSGNHLTGEIPEWLSRFPATAYVGNKKLCGKPLPYNCTDHKKLTLPEEEPTAISAPKKHGTGALKKLLAFIAVDAAAGLGVILIIIWCCCKNRQSNGLARKQGHSIVRWIFGKDPPIGITANSAGHNEEMVVFEGCKGFVHVEDLLKASAELLGKGCIGTTYKVVVESSESIRGPLLAVKRVRPERCRGTRWRREANGWLKLIGGLRHLNLASLRAYYHSMEELLLVYDYIPNGSLYSLLHDNRGPGRTHVDWTTRMKLASDSARGLAFLHQHSKAKLFHGHLTTSNILIDRLGNALVSDVGLTHLFPASLSNDLNQAPELNRKANSNGSISHYKYAQHCDVYSFGVVLLEILTGKTASGEGETSLVNWVRRVSERKGLGREVFDFEVFLSGEKEVVEAEMTAVLKVALQCLAPDPRDRPKMGVIYRIIEDIRTKGGTGGLATFASDSPSSDSSPSHSEDAS